MNTNRRELKRKRLKSQIVTLDAQPLSQQLNVILSEAKNLGRSSRNKKAAGIRWVAAPRSSSPDAPAVQGIMLAPNEAVQWTWTHKTTGSYVSGYTIVRRKRSGSRRSR